MIIKSHFKNRWCRKVIVMTIHPYPGKPRQLHRLLVLLENTLALIPHKNLKGNYYSWAEISQYKKSTWPLFSIRENVFFLSFSHHIVHCSLSFSTLLQPSARGRTWEDPSWDLCYFSNRMDFWFWHLHLSSKPFQFKCLKKKTISNLNIIFILCPITCIWCYWFY